MNANELEKVPEDRFEKAIAKLAKARPEKANSVVSLPGSLAATIKECQQDGTDKIAHAIGQLSTRLGQKTSGLAVALCIAAFEVSGDAKGKVGEVLKGLELMNVSDVAAISDVDGFHGKICAAMKDANLSKIAPKREEWREFVALAKVALLPLKKVNEATA